ncbi:hypothetical protein [Paraburkholderia monticola]
MRHADSFAACPNISVDHAEVQSGAYLGGDDIVRFEDTNGRVAKV